MFLEIMIMLSLAVSAKGFRLPAASTASRMINSSLRATVATSSPTQSAEKVVLDPLPVVYVYDHCPYCVRVRVALGLKNVKHDVRFMMNDDVATPSALVGKKIAPIFERSGVTEPMAESMDIIKLIDADPAYGPTNFFKPASGRQDLKDWMKKVAGVSRIHQRSRYMKTYLPEFATYDAKNAFVTNHQLAPYEKADWKANLDDATRWRLYEEAWDKSTELIPETNTALKELEPMIFSPDYCTEGGLSYDDIELWSRLRSLTLVKGVEFPAGVKAYMDNLAAKGDVPTYFSIAL